MRISVIFVVLTLSVIVRGWATLLQPIALSIGAAFAALNLDVDLIFDLEPAAWKLSSSNESTSKLTMKYDKEGFEKYIKG